MKLVYFSTAYYARHGGRNHSKAFVEAARKHPGVDYLIIFPRADILRKAVSRMGWTGWLKSFIAPKTLFMPFRLLRKNKFYFRELVNLIEREKPQAIIIRLDNNFLQVVRLKKRFPDLVVITEVNSSSFDEAFKNIWPARLFRKLERWALSHSDLNFFVSAYLRNRIMQNRIDNSRDIVNHNGVDLNKFHPATDRTTFKTQLGFSPDEILIGYVGSLSTYKRLDILLESFRLIRRKIPKSKLVIVGGGEDLQRLKRYQRQNSEANVVVIGPQPHERIPFYLKAFDLAIHHFAYEYMSPLKLFEYLASQLPVVAPDTKAVREVFENGKHVLYTQPDPEMVARQALRLLNDEKLASRLAMTGYQYVANHYTWEKNANLIIESAISKTNNKAGAP